MKPFFRFTLFVLLAVLPQLIPAQSRKALLIGIAQYQDAAIPHIFSDRDVAAMQNGLMAVGYQEKNIHILVNKQATLDGIYEAWNELIYNAHQGDTIWVHISAHGQRMIDLEPIDEGDGLDECILAYDSPIDYVPNDPNFGQKHLRDDEINGLCHRLCDKIGPSGVLFLSIDACHAGTGARQLNYRASRGLENILGWAGGNLPRPETHYSIGTLPDNMAAFYAAAPNEYSYATADSLGALSSGLAQVLAKLDQGADVRQLFSQLQGVMSKVSPNQSPSYEGNGNLLVQSGNRLTNRSYHCFDSSYKQCWIGAGILEGIHPNTKVALYLPGQDIPLARGTVDSAMALKARVHIDGELKDYGELAECSAKVTAISYGQMSLRWRWDGVDGALAANLSARLSDQKAIVCTPEHEPFDLTLYATTDSCHLVTYDGWSIWKAKRTHPKLEDTIVMRAKAYMLTQYLRGLEFVDKNGLNGSVDLVLPDLNNLPIGERVNTRGESFVREGEKHCFVITNNNPVDIYFALMEINPDGTYDFYPNQKTGSIHLAPGAKHRTPIYSMRPPYGLQTLKLLVARMPVNWEARLGEHGLTRGSTRGLSPQVLEEEGVCSSSLYYYIVR